MTEVPQQLYGTARYQFGSWPAALAAAGVDSRAVRKSNKKYTKEVIVARLRKAACDGSDLLSTSLARVLDLKAVNREFGTLESALRAAGLLDRLMLRRHGLTTWTAERLIGELKARAQRKDHSLTPLLHRYARKFFGSVDDARRVARVPSPLVLRRKQPEPARRVVKA